MTMSRTIRACLGVGAILFTGAAMPASAMTDQAPASGERGAEVVVPARCNPDIRDCGRK